MRRALRKEFSWTKARTGLGCSRLALSRAAAECEVAGEWQGKEARTLLDSVVISA